MANIEGTLVDSGQTENLPSSANNTFSEKNTILSGNEDQTSINMDTTHNFEAEKKDSQCKLDIESTDLAKCDTGNLMSAAALDNKEQNSKSHSDSEYTVYTNKEIVNSLSTNDEKPLSNEPVESKAEKSSHINSIEVNTGITLDQTEGQNTSSDSTSLGINIEALGAKHLATIIQSFDSNQTDKDIKLDNASKDAAEGSQQENNPKVSQLMPEKNEVLVTDDLIDFPLESQAISRTETQVSIKMNLSKESQEKLNICPDESKKVNENESHNKIDIAEEVPPGTEDTVITKSITQVKEEKTKEPEGQPIKSVSRGRVQQTETKKADQSSAESGEETYNNQGYSNWSQWNWNQGPPGPRFPIRPWGPNNDWRPTGQNHDWRHPGPNNEWRPPGLNNSWRPQGPFNWRPPGPNNNWRPHGPPGFWPGHQQQGPMNQAQQYAQQYSQWQQNYNPNASQQDQYTAYQQYNQNYQQSYYNQDYTQQSNWYGMWGQQATQSYTSAGYQMSQTTSEAYTNTQDTPVTVTSSNFSNIINVKLSTDTSEKLSPPKKSLEDIPLPPPTPLEPVPEEVKEPPPPLPKSPPPIEVAPPEPKRLITSLTKEEIAAKLLEKARKKNAGTEHRDTEPEPKRLKQHNLEKAEADQNNSIRLQEKLTEINHGDRDCKQEQEGNMALPEEGASQRHLCIGNLPSDTKAVGLRDFLRNYGRVTMCKIAAGKGKNAGIFAFVTIETLTDQNILLSSLSGMEYNGSKLSVKKLKSPPGTKAS